MIGKRIGGRYQLLSVVGGGGMAVVYKARDVILDRIVAVKVLRPEFSHDDEFIRRFRREAQSVTSLSHPSIVNIYDVGDNTDEHAPGDKDGDIYYIVMQYIEGETLKDLIKREAPLPLGQALHIMDQITSAIKHAHERNIVHRDIKPQNILIDYEGQAKVTDFGIAVAMTSATITHTNSVIGSAHYFSPEQAKGGYANTKSDIYSLGIVLFEMMTGELPFSGTSPISVALKHLQEDIPDPRELNPAIPQSVENIILKALSKDPNHRYDTVEAMREDLKTALDPDRMNEQKFVAPNDGEQTTKIMAPVVGGMGNDNSGDSGNDNGGSGNSGSGDGNEPKKKKKTKKVLWIILLLLLLLGGAAVAAVFVLPDLLEVPTVKVPKVVGMDSEKATQLLKQKGLKVNTEKVINDEYDKGIVARQDPAAGFSVKESSPVDLFVSKGPEKVAVDNYRGEYKNRVQLILKESDFKKVDFKPVHSDTYDEGMIFKQNPAPDTKVVPSKTELVLTYSSGPRKESVPDLTDYTKEGAQNLLEDNGLTPDFQEEEYSDTVEKGMVTRQSPNPDAKVDQGGTVQFWISKGPEPQPDPGQTGDGQPGDGQSGDTTSGDSQSGDGQSGDGQSQASPIEVHQPIQVRVNEDTKSHKPSEVIIKYTDSSHPDPTVFVDDKKVKETKIYHLTMTVNPGDYEEFWVYKDGQQVAHDKKTYDEVSQDANGGNQ